MGNIALFSSTASFSNLLDYIGSDSIKVPYLYSNLMLYSDITPFIKVWVDYCEDEIIGIYLLYHTCLHFYSKTADYPTDAVLSMIEEVKPSVMIFEEKMGQRLVNLLPERYKLDLGYIAGMQNSPSCYSNIVENANREDLEEVVRLLLVEDIYQKVYTYNTLKQLMIERYDAGYGSVFCVKENNRVVAAVCVSAANKDFIFEGGLIVHESQRGKGLAQLMLKHLWQWAKDEGKFCLCYIESDNIASYKMHEKLGAEFLSKIYKFI